MIFFALLFGLAAAVLRGFQLANSFDAAQLIPSGDPLTLALMGLSALFVVCAALLAFRARPKERKPLGDAWLALQLTALAALFTASAYDIYRGFADLRVAVICLGVLGLFAGASLLYIALSLNKLAYTSATGFWATVPVFWACFMLIVEFWGHASNPVRNAFMYGMLAAVFCTLALYAAAGFFFGRARRKWTLFYAMAGLFFAVTALGGSLLARFALEATADAATIPLSSMLRLAFIALHMAALMVLVPRGLLTPPETEEIPNAAPKDGV